VAAVVLGFLLLKALVLWAMARAMPLPLAGAAGVRAAGAGRRVRLRGLPGRAGRRVIDAEARRCWSAAVAVSMLLTPLLLVATDRWLLPRLRAASAARCPTWPRSPSRRTRRSSSPASAATARSWAGCSTPTACRHRAGPQTPRGRGVRRFGWPAFLWRRHPAGPAAHRRRRQARVMVLAIDDVEQSLAVVDLAREHFPQAAAGGAGAQRHALDGCASGA
jgi:glutathione-regulated potassium-efflux system ancillary protein KefC